MKKFLIVLVLATLLSPVSALDLRQSVYIVRPHYSIQTERKMKAASYPLQKKYPDAFREVYEGYTRVSGSGFLIARRDTSCLVLTNRHVIGFADQVDLIRVLQSGTQDTLSGKVLRVDPVYDLALLSFRLPEGCESIPLETTLPEEGDEVYAAGFPGLWGSKVSWQLSRGVVSNIRVVDEGLKGSDCIPFLQHSSPIDPGNSGGPLLHRKSKTSYTVVGINTYKVKWRENTNIALPVEAVRAFLRDSVSSFAQRVTALEKAVREQDADALADLMAYARFNSMNRKEYDRLIKLQDKALKARETKLFSEGEGIAGYRLLFVGELLQWFKNETNPQFEIDEASHTLTFSVGGKSHRILWQLEHGLWRIAGVE